MSSSSITLPYLCLIILHIQKSTQISASTQNTYYFTSKVKFCIKQIYFKVKSKHLSFSTGVSIYKTSIRSFLTRLVTIFCSLQSRGSAKSFLDNYYEASIPDFYTLKSYPVQKVRHFLVSVILKQFRCIGTIVYANTFYPAQHHFLKKAGITQQQKNVGLSELILSY